MWDHKALNVWIALIAVFGWLHLGAAVAALDYRATISAIVANAGVFVKDDLIEDERLQVLYETPSEHLGEARKLIADDSAPFHERRMALISMQCLPLAQYLDLLLFVSRLKTSEDNRLLVQHAILPGFPWSTRIALLFENEKVRAALHQVDSSPLADKEVNATVRDVLSGHIATYIKDKRYKPRWQCQHSE